MTNTETTFEAGSPTGEPASKRCSRCHEYKDPSLFSKKKAAKDGLQNQCKACNAAWQHENTEARRDTWRRYRRATYMLEKYGLTIEEYWQLYAAQGERCAICRVHGDDAGQHTVQQLPLHVDHDHETGAVRGLLCRGCNMGLGAFRDSIEALEGAITYLQRPAPSVHTGLAGEPCVLCGVVLTNRTRGRRCLPMRATSTPVTSPSLTSARP